MENVLSEKSPAEKAAETRELNRKKQEESDRRKEYNAELVPVTIMISRYTDKILDHYTRKIGMSKTAFVEGCIMSYAKGNFKMLDGEPLFIKDTHTIEEIRRII